MAKEIRIEQLEASDKPEMLGVVAEAFRDKPQPIPNTRSKVTRILISGIQRLLDKTTGTSLDPSRFLWSPDVLSYGIRQDGKLVCVAILSDSCNRPEKLSILSRMALGAIGFLISLVFRLGQILRWRTAIELERLGKEMPGYYKGRYLELDAFGTLPAYQKQGFGSEMLRFIYKRAESEGYEGIRLVTSRDIPAFHLYIKEGFAVKMEWNITGANAILMQLTFLENPSPTAHNSG